MRVEDGNTEILKCSGFVNESKCALSQKFLDLKEIQICKKFETVIWLKNLNHYPAIFHIDKLPQNTEITPIKDKIPSDERFPLNITIFSDKELTIEDYLIIKLRGGSSLK